ncbi:MAG: hypothetical protein D0531_00140, partial [Methylococcales bacterium]
VNADRYAFCDACKQVCFNAAALKRHQHACKVLKGSHSRPTSSQRTEASGAEPAVMARSEGSPGSYSDPQTVLGSLVERATENTFIRDKQPKPARRGLKRFNELIKSDDFSSGQEDFMCDYDSDIDSELLLRRNSQNNFLTKRPKSDHLCLIGDDTMGIATLSIVAPVTTHTVTNSAALITNGHEVLEENIDENSLYWDISENINNRTIGMESNNDGNVSIPALAVCSTTGSGSENVSSTLENTNSQSNLRVTTVQPSHAGNSHEESAIAGQSGEDANPAITLNPDVSLNHASSNDTEFIVDDLLGVEDGRVYGSSENLKFHMPIRDVRKNKLVPFMGLVEACLQRAILETSSKNDVLSFLLCPAVSSLETVDLTTLAHETDVTSAVLNQWRLHRYDTIHYPCSASAVPKSLLVKCEKLIRVNRVGDAVKRLDSFINKIKPVSLLDPIISDRIKSLHPKASDKDRLPVTDVSGSPVDFTIETLADAISELPKESGCGIYPWSNDLIKLCFEYNDNLKQLIYRFVKLLVNGKISNKEVWLRSRLIALANGEKLRPIAISDSWIRLGSRIMVKLCLAEVDTYIGAKQLGIGKKGGAEILVHATNIMRDKLLSADVSAAALGIFGLDCANAFNSIRRSKIAEGIRAACPKLLPYFYWCYESATDLCADVYSPAVCASASGVRQGDPLGPMLFCLGIAKTLDNLSNKFPDITILAYLDDIFMLGDSDRCLAAFKNLSTNFGQLGLKFNKNKCTMFAKHTPVNCDVSVSRNGIMVLGLPVGDAEFIQSHLEKQRVAQVKALQLLEHFQTQQAYAILKTSINQRPVFNVRSLTPVSVSDYAVRFDENVDAALKTMVNANRFDEDSSIVRSLPVQMGGLGMKKLSSIKEVAYTTSWLTSLQYIKLNFSLVYDSRANILFDGEMIRNLASVLPHVPDGDSNQFDDLIVPIISGRSPIPTQKELAKTLDRPRLEALLNRLKLTSPEKAAWLMSSSMEGLHSWLNCGTTDIAGLSIDDADFVEAIRLRLLLPIHEDIIPTNRRCKSCRAEKCSDLHALSCKIPSSLRITRHNFVRDALHKFVKSAVNTAIVTPESKIPNSREGKSQLKADLMINLGPQTIYVDVAITNPSSPSNVRGNVELVPLVAADHMEKAKRTKYQEAYGPDILPVLVPFVVESTGRLGVKAKEFIDRLCGLVPGGRANKQLQKARKFFYSRLAVFLVKGNGPLIRCFRQTCETLRN